MAYTKPQTLDASPSGDTVKTAIISKLDVNAAQIVSDLNTHEALTTTHGATGGVVGTTKVQTLTNKTLTSPVINTGVSGTAIDTDVALTANSNTILASQKAVKAYVDNKTQTYLFDAYLTNSVLNVTGNGAEYNLKGSIWTEVTDASAVFSDGTFTAPVTGTYQFNGRVYLMGIASGHTDGYIIATGSHTIYLLMANLYSMSDGGILVYTFSFTKTMTEGDTLYLQCYVNGGSKDIDIVGSNTTFSGYLIG